MDKSIRETSPGENHEELAYADDAAVMVDNLQELQDVASTWKSTMTINGMRINTAKGKAATIRLWA